MTDAKQIITEWVYPPIPCRDYDHRAYYRNEEESGVCGYGRTPQAAIENLIDKGAL